MVTRGSSTTQIDPLVYELVWLGVVRADGGKKYGLLGR